MQKNHKKNRINKYKCRKFLKNSVIVVNGTILCTMMIPFCALFVLIDVVWVLTDEMIKKLD